MKIGDFGISKQTNNNTVTKRTFVGTPWYMAPEIIEEKPYSCTADIWSLGCCIIHMATLERPYAGLNAVQTLLSMTKHKSPILKLSKKNKKKINSIKHLKKFLIQCFKKSRWRPGCQKLL